MQQLDLSSAQGKGAAVGELAPLIAELDELRQRGIISAAEFDKKKNDLLDRL